MEKLKRVVIAEDFTILREGLRALLSSIPKLEVAGEASDGYEAIKCVEKKKPDLVLMDISMPRMNGIDAIKKIKKDYPHIKVLALTVHEHDEYIMACLQAGADGYVLKDASWTELKTAINTILAGQRYLSPDVSETIIEGYLEGKKTVKKKSAWDTVTQREREILKLIAEGLTNKRIADFLCISIKTVEKHRANLMKKLGLRNVTELTSFAIKKGIIEN